MFEAVELGRKVSKADYNDQQSELRTGLLAAQRALKDTNKSVVIIVGGVEGAGKSEVVNRLMEWLDPRTVRVLPADERLQSGHEAVIGDADLVRVAGTDRVRDRTDPDDQQARTAACPRLVIGGNTFAHRPVRLGEVRAHRRHRDPIARLERTDPAW